MIKRLKERKSTEGDGIVNENIELWERKVREWLQVICNRIWRGVRIGWRNEGREWWSQY